MHTYPFNQMPWESLLHQKFRLFSFFAASPVSGLYGIPVDFIQLRQVVPVFKIIGTSIRQCKYPTPIVQRGPLDGFVEICLQMYNLLLRLKPESVLSRNFLNSIEKEHPFIVQRQLWSSIDAKTAIDRLLGFDWKTTLADNDLPKVLGAANLAGIDIGFPLLSQELMDFSMRLPPRLKLKGLRLRWFFKYALRDFLPAEIISKKKHGFGLPFGVWSCEHPALMKLAQDAVYGLRDRGLVQEAFVDKLLKDDLPSYPHYYGEMVWILMMLELWLQNHAPSWKVAD